nr:hypothetical protein [Tanacetum cinerariifolium]
QGAVVAAFQHNIDYHVERFVAKALGGADKITCGIVEQNIYAAKFFVSARQHGFNGIVLTHIAGHSQHPAAGLLAQLGSGSFQHVELAAGYGYVGPELEKICTASPRLPGTGYHYYSRATSDTASSGHRAASDAAGGRFCGCRRSPPDCFPAQCRRAGT